MDTTHTPGPWKMVRTPTYWGLRDSLTGRLLAMVPHKKNSDANARLIAAAPDLLTALQVVVADWTAQFERNGHLAPAWCQQARAAIAIATGQAPTGGAE